MKQLTLGVGGVAAFGAAALVAAFWVTNPGAPGAPVEPVSEVAETPAVAGTAPPPAATASAPNVARVDPSTPALPVATPPPAPLPIHAQAVLPSASAGEPTTLGASAASLASRHGARHERQAGLVAQLRHSRTSPREEHATGGTACPQGDCSGPGDRVPLRRNPQPVGAQ